VFGFGIFFSGSRGFCAFAVLEMVCGLGTYKDPR